MTLKTYRGTCHCGAVRFEADVDLGAGLAKCNCSLCTKARAWFAFVKPERLRLLAGAEAQADYRWVPPGRPYSFLCYHFCKTCGIRTFGEGGDAVSGGAFRFINVAALDDADRDELASAPTRFVDGRHDRFDQPPADTRLM